ncbi:hypothetical protein LINPERPRIM_LOCUS35187 [Linum perenne]
MITATVPKTANQMTDEDVEKLKELGRWRRGQGRLVRCDDLHVFWWWYWN